MNSQQGIRVHELKTWPEAFEAIRDGRKTWEVRRDDRSPIMREGDLLQLREWDPDERAYTGEEETVRVTYLLPLAQFGAGPFVGMSIARTGMQPCRTCNGDMVVPDPENPVVGNPCPDCTIASSRTEP